MRFEAKAEGRLDKVLSDLMPEESRSRLARHIRNGGVKVDGRVASASHRVRRGQVIEVEPLGESVPQSLQPANIPLEVLFEDEWLLVVNKPAGLSSHPSPTGREPTLVEALLAYGSHLSTEGGAFRPGIVHRLDKETSGALLVAKTDAVHRSLQTAIQQKQVGRRYLVWTRGAPDQKNFSVKCCLGRHPKNRKKFAVVQESAPDARASVSHFSLIGTERTGPCKFAISCLEAVLETGRTHQIRVHCASIGLPVIGDRLYGVECEVVTRQALHASVLDFRHPVTSQRVRIVAPIPPELRELAKLFNLS